MILKLLALFTIIPLIELALLIPLGAKIGVWPTIGLVVATALLGAVLGKSQGIKAWAKIQQDLRTGKLPADSLLDGFAVLVAGIFLITPGVLTDAIALVLLIPPARRPLRALVRKRFEKMLSEGTMTFISSQPSPFQNDQTSPFSGPSPGQGDIIDVTPNGDDERSR